MGTGTGTGVGVGMSVGVEAGVETKIGSLLFWSRKVKDDCARSEQEEDGEETAFGSLGELLIWCSSRNNDEIRLLFGWLRRFGVVVK